MRMTGSPGRGTALALLFGALGSAVPIAATAQQAPFQAEEIASFNAPWAIAILPDDRLLVTEKGGQLFLVTPGGEAAEVSGVPDVDSQGQNGFLHIAAAPGFAEDATVYFTFSEPNDSRSAGNALALARATLAERPEGAMLADIEVIWREGPPGDGGHPGGIIAFSPDGEYLYLTVGDRQRLTPAQDPEQALGNVLRFGLDGSVPAENPMADAEGVQALTWTTGHRNPYGLAFAPDGELWLHEMGPRGGDEMNLLEPGLNYGWPEVSEGVHYSGEGIAGHDSRPEFTPPVVSWTPVISPAGLAFHPGGIFPDWEGSALIGGLSAEGLIRVEVDGRNAQEAERFDMGARIRDVEVSADGTVWVIEDGSGGRLLRLTPAD